jgi:predicted MFS family arabinose efflux permease
VRSSRGNAAVVLGVLGSAAFVGAWNFTLLAPVLKDVAADTGVSVTAAGQLVTVSAAATVVALLALGPLADRYRRSRMLMIGLAAMGLAALGSSFTDSYPVLMGLRVVTGVGDALVLPTAAAAVTDYFEGKDREVALNLLLVPMGVAVVAGLPVVVVINDTLGWHAAFAVFAACNLVAFLLVRFLLPPAAVSAPAEGSLGDHYRRSYRDTLGKRQVLVVLGAGVLAATVWNGMVTYAGAFFEDELDASDDGLIALFAALGISYVVGGAVGAALARRVNPRLIAVCSALGAIVFLLPLVSATDVLPLAVVFAVGFAGTRAPGIAALNNLLLDLAPQAQATAVATYGVVAASGALLGAATGGLALELEGFTAVAGLFTVLAAGGAFLLVAPIGERVAAPVAAGPSTGSG